ncbi:hypothetical protein L7F22_024887 [Adiantum nelumboides]|nr:hypothetical protein [Adiantum nelumboides]MCO5571153.1 hypothetical protein [Adiantum nelumboides]
MDGNYSQVVAAAAIAVTIAVTHWQICMELLLQDVSFDDINRAFNEHEDNLETLMCFMQAITVVVNNHRVRKASAEGLWYVKPRSRHFWCTFFNYTEGDDIRFEENIGIPQTCYLYICDLLRFDLQQKNIPLQILEDVPSRALTVEKKVAMSLHYLDVGGPAHNIANTYGLGLSTVSRVFCQFIGAMMKHRSKFIHWPRTTIDLQQFKDGFEAKQGFPNCCGALDVTHINMDLPCGEAHVAWYDRNHSYSMTLQAVIGSEIRFLSVMSGAPGVCNDIRILRNSPLHSKAQNNQILNGPTIQCASHCIREYIIAR